MLEFDVRSPLISRQVNYAKIPENQVGKFDEIPVNLNIRKNARKVY